MILFLGEKKKEVKEISSVFPSAVTLFQTQNGETRTGFRNWLVLLSILVTFYSLGCCFCRCFSVWWFVFLVWFSPLIFPVQVLTDLVQKFLLLLLSFLYCCHRRIHLCFFSFFSPAAPIYSFEPAHLPSKITTVATNQESFLPLALS